MPMDCDHRFGNKSRLLREPMGEGPPGGRDSCPGRRDFSLRTRGRWADDQVNCSPYRFEKPRDDLGFIARWGLNVYRLTSTTREIRSPGGLTADRESRWLGGPAAVRRKAAFYLFTNRERGRETFWLGSLS